MQNFTQSNVRKMQDEMIQVLNKYGFKNVSFNAVGARFSAAECTFKIKGAVDGVKTIDQTMLERHAKIDGVDIKTPGPKGETLIEYHNRKPKYPYIYTTVSGKRFKCSSFQAQRMFPA